MSDKEEATAAAAAAAEEQTAPAPVADAEKAVAAAGAEEKEAEAKGDAVEEVTQSLEEILALGQGLDDQDYKAELEVLQNDPNSNLFSAVTFEELNLCVWRFVYQDTGAVFMGLKRWERGALCEMLLYSGQSRCSRACTP